MNKEIKHVYVYKYTTNFNDGKEQKMKIFSTLENARKFGIEYYKTGFRILHYEISVYELDFNPENNNIYANGCVLEKECK